MDEDEDRVRELAKLCCDEGILPTSIDPGEMTVNGREVTFKVNNRIDKTKVDWLKDHTVTVIFWNAARFLPKKTKDDLVRAYEDTRTQEGDFESNTFRRGRIKVEGLNVVSYVSRSAAVKQWLLAKGRDEITLGQISYVMEFKPWLTKAQLREQRRREEESNLCVIAVQVPLDAMFYLEAQIAKAIGLVINSHPAEQDRQKPALINLKFDLEPDASWDPGNAEQLIGVWSVACAINHMPPFPPGGYGFPLFSQEGLGGCTLGGQLGGSVHGGGGMYAATWGGGAGLHHASGGQVHGTHDTRGGFQGGMSSPNREAVSDNRGTGGTPGKQRRLRQEDSATSDLRGVREEKSGSMEFEGSQGRIREIITPGTKTTRKRIPVAVARGQ
ncbi:hypothetical protein CBR_g50018 [Chara braunii]|uniref:Uncharacterized protein n=1 Tax=Chara braunii TaxID=69332 RepID=A0A388K5A2_CHABU|nr:hypothetical protein CBR_g50018 [Chara braunii]|eukprot:GBG65227.1 hypothetical protein CBR_g50018 [Chara braunii]